MIPTWLIIVVGLAVAVALLWPLVVIVLGILFAGVCFVLVGILTVVDNLLVKVGFYRWRSRRRVEKIKAARERARR